MAILLDKTASSGIPVSYHVIGAWSVKKGDGFATVLVQSWPDEVTRRTTIKKQFQGRSESPDDLYDAPSEPLIGINVTLPILDDPTRADLYGALKQHVDFLGAQDA